jgi:hypothetical protein
VSPYSKDLALMNLNSHLRKRFKDGEYAISDHAIIEARKDGLEPRTVEKLEWVAINGEVIEEYVDRKRVLIYAELKEESLPVHIIVDYSLREEPVIVTAYVPDSRYWLNYKTRKTRK